MAESADDALGAGMGALGAEGILAIETATPASELALAVDAGLVGVRGGAVGIVGAGVGIGFATATPTSELAQAAVDVGLVEGFGVRGGADGRIGCVWGGAEGTAKPM